MLSGFRWLALETWYLDRALAFYTDVLDQPITERSDTEAVVDVGPHSLRLQEPGPVPRGGLHVHFALATPPDRYPDWKTKFTNAGKTWTHDFGENESVYTYDPDDHCVEIGDVGAGDAPITGVFEVALEVESLDRARAFYEHLGFEPVDYGDDRRRCRLSGPIALELWEPQRGIADARGAVHAHLAFEAPDPPAASDAVCNTAQSVETLPDGVRIQDPDGHYLTIYPPAETDNRNTGTDPAN